MSWTRGALQQLAPELERLLVRHERSGHHDGEHAVRIEQTPTRFEADAREVRAPAGELPARLRRRESVREEPIVAAHRRDVRLARRRLEMSKLATVGLEQLPRRVRDHHVEVLRRSRGQPERVAGREASLDARSGARAQIGDRLRGDLQRGVVQVPERRLPLDRGRPRRDRRFDELHHQPPVARERVDDTDAAASRAPDAQRRSRHVAGDPGVRVVTPGRFHDEGVRKLDLRRAYFREMSQCRASQGSVLQAKSVNDTAPDRHPYFHCPAPGV